MAVASRVRFVIRACPPVLPLYTRWHQVSSKTHSLNNRIDRRTTMLRPNPSGAPVPSFDHMKSRPLGLSRPPAGLERRDLPTPQALVRPIPPEFPDTPGLLFPLPHPTP